MAEEKKKAPAKKANADVKKTTAAKKETAKAAAKKEAAEDTKVKNKNKQVRYVFKNENGWFEKERDNVRVTKYHKTQKEAIESSVQHIKNSGLAGSVVVQSRKGKIRANTKVSAKK